MKASKEVIEYVLSHVPKAIEIACEKYADRPLGRELRLPLMPNPFSEPQELINIALVRVSGDPIWQFTGKFIHSLRWANGHFECYTHVIADSDEWPESLCT